MRFLKSLESTGARLAVEAVLVIAAFAVGGLAFQHREAVSAEKFILSRDGVARAALHFVAYGKDDDGPGLTLYAAGGKKRVELALRTNVRESSDRPELTFFDKTGIRPLARLVVYPIEGGAEDAVLMFFDPDGEQIAEYPIPKSK